MTSISENYFASRPRSDWWSSLREKPFHFMVFALDLVALMAAYQLSLPLTEFLISHFHTSSLQHFYPAAEMRQIVYSGLLLGILLFLFMSGHYSKRIPYWSQLHQIGKIMVFAVLVDGFASFALDLNYSRLFIATNWAVALVMIVVTRLGVNILKSRSAGWRTSSRCASSTAPPGGSA